ncbi:MAG: endolytic transglycosylase MltG [Candidatus Pacebacteria bacterium]|nr:endolytic transglycosylase MltG [Candidatus Paceibacterota bacterium]
MEQNDNLTPLKYESDTAKSADKPSFSVPPDMKYDVPSNSPVSVALKPPPIHTPRKRFLVAAVIFFIVAVLVMVAFAIVPSAAFPKGTVFRVEANSSLGQITDNLYNDHVIKSEALFKSFVIAFSGQRGIKAGDYLFAAKESVIEIAWRLVHGEQGLATIKVTIPEGYDNLQISQTLGKDIQGFSTSTFMAEAAPLEGSLFPDTYFFNIKTSPDDAIKAMNSLFDQKIGGESAAIADSGRATSSVVIMASLLEREATSSADRRVIAGILWKRLDGKMPLQVDAALAYALNKNGAKLTSADLATSSSFNTYKNLGLPPSPIGNPGLSAITDAISPASTTYWYYLSDSNGNIHFAATYDEQIANEAKYL